MFRLKSDLTEILVLERVNDLSLYGSNGDIHADPVDYFEKVCVDSVCISSTSIITSFSFIPCSISIKENYSSRICKKGWDGPLSHIAHLSSTPS